MNKVLTQDETAEFTAVLLRKLLVSHGVVLVLPANHTSLVKVARDLHEYLSTPLFASAVKSSAKQDPSDLIRVEEVSRLIGLARPTIYKMLKEPSSGFPKQVKLVPGSVGKGAPVAWVRGEVEAWMAERLTVRAEKKDV